MERYTSISLLLLFCYVTVVASVELASPSPPPVDHCVAFGTCDMCSNQRVARCGWCASDSLGNGVCMPMSGTGAPAQGYTCPTGFWNEWCCAKYSSCDECANSKGRCKWCEKGSKVNGGQCIPFDGTGRAALGGCDDDYYTNWCCRDFGTCGTCNQGNKQRCQWCFDGSAVNPGQCLPYNGQGSPMYGGCSQGYYSPWCCGKFDRCDTCTKSGERCGWCGANSSVNAQSCITYDGRGVPMEGGCTNEGQWVTNPYRCPIQPNCNNGTQGNCTKCVEGCCVACTRGTWGESCERQCDSACSSITGCNIDTGECIGCESARACGSQCEETCASPDCMECDQGCGECVECASGVYGKKCADVCSHCLQFDCDTTTGQCNKGCTAGWQGPYCTTPCTATCPTDMVCTNMDECECAPGYAKGLFGCVKANLGISCEECEKLVGSAKLMTTVAKEYKTYAQAKSAIEAIGCFFLLPPLDLGCAAVVAEESLSYFIVSQVSEKLLTDGFCAQWGACT